MQANPTANSTPMATTFVANGSQTILPSLQPLMQLVKNLAEIDAPQLQKWFEFARLTRPVTSSGAATQATDLFTLLRPLAQAENLEQELTHALRRSSPHKAEGESGNARTNAADALPFQVREGLKLVEQSLSQNLLQRASLGLQQESQQTLNLSLVLPFIDQQQVRPLQVELEQRAWSQEKSDQTWEIRLNFELGSLGPMACHLVLEGNAVAASFYCALDETRVRVELELPLLRQQLSRAGFDPGEFHSFTGLPAADQATDRPVFSESLLDVEA